MKKNGKVKFAAVNLPKWFGFLVFKCLLHLSGEFCDNPFVLKPYKSCQKSVIVASVVSADEKLKKNVLLIVFARVKKPSQPSIHLLYCSAGSDSCYAVDSAVHGAVGNDVTLRALRALRALRDLLDTRGRIKVCLSDLNRIEALHKDRTNITSEAFEVLKDIKALNVKRKVKRRVLKQLSSSQVNTSRVPCLNGLYYFLLILLSGDVEIQPGPTSNPSRSSRSGSGSRSRSRSRSPRTQPRRSPRSRSPSSRTRFDTSRSSLTGNAKADLQVLTLNVRGLSNMKKVRHLVNKCYKLSKIAVNSIFMFQETYVTQLNLLRYLWRGEYYLTPGQGHSTGCLTLVTAPHKIVHSEDLGTRGHVLVLAKGDTNKAEMIVANVYAPNGQGDDKKVFFEELHELISDLSINYSCQRLILAGDLNLVFNANEVKNRAISHAEERMSRIAKTLFDGLNLVDGWNYVPKKQFTWMTNRTGQEVFSTLDRIMFTQDDGFKIKEKRTDWSISVSDHAAVIATFTFNAPTKACNPMSSRLDPKLLLDQEGRILLDETFRELFEQLSPDWNPHVSLEYCKMCIRTAANTASGRLKAKLRDDEAEINSSINEIVTELAMPNLEQVTRDLLMHKLDDLRQLKRALVEKVGEKLQQRTARKWYNEGELSNRYFFNMLNRKVNDDIDVLVKDDGSEIKEKAEIENELRSFYKKLYEEPTDTEPANIDDNFFRNIAPVDQNLAGVLVTELTIQELHDTLKTCHDSAPGPDGIPYSFLKHFWPHIGPLLLEAWKLSLETGNLPTSHKTSYLRLIPKAGKDPRVVANLRPITLSNTDHKLITKAYSKRLTSLLSNSIGEEQTAYIPGRLINDNIRSLLMTIDLANVDATVDGIVVSLDAKKAFDSVDHGYIRKCLAAYGLGNFVPIFDTLYKDLNSMIIVNGHPVEGYRILRGVKQGDALSCIIFIMCVEPLLKNLKENNLIEPINSDHLPIDVPKAYSFADDVTVVTQNTPMAVQAIFNEYEKFSEASGLVLNASKTEFLNFNHRGLSDQIHDFTYRNEQYSVQSLEQIKVNGIFLLQDTARRELVNVTKARTSMERLLQAWSTRCLTLLGKILIIKTYAISQAIYLMQSLTLSDASIKSFDKLIYKYLWNRNFNGIKAPDRIKRSIMMTPCHLGGFGMLDIKLLGNSLDLRALGRLMESKHPFMRQVNALLNNRNFFNVKLESAVDDKIKNGLRLLNSARSEIPSWPKEIILSNLSIVNLLRDMRLSNIITAAGIQSINYLSIHRRIRSPKINQITIAEFRSISRYLIDRRLADVLPDLINYRQAIPVNLEVTKCFPTKTKDLVALGTLTSKVLRLSMVDEEANLICLYKVGAILVPGEVLNWTKATRRLTSTRHRNILLRVAHGDIFSNDRQFRFGLRATANCSNCPELIETTIHRLKECPHAVLAWNKLEELKTRIGLNVMTDLTIENLLGAKDQLSKIELALNAELLLKLSTRSEAYCPNQLAYSALKLIGYSERLDPDLLNKIKEVLANN